MSENIETGLVVGPVTVVDNGDKSGVTVVMKGQKTVTHETGAGYTTEDTVEISLTFKFGSILTAEKLGIARHMDAKVFVLRDRDMLLSEYEGIVPDETLDKIRQTVPGEILRTLS